MKLFRLNDQFVEEGINDGCLFRFIWAIGGPGSGKTTLAATIAPVRPGQKSRTLFLDLEGSSDTISSVVGLDVVSVRNMAQERQAASKEKNLAFHLFDVVYEILMNLGDHDYDVLVIDTASDLKIGANAWTRKHPELFGKAEQNYRGEQGTIFSWGDTKTFWKQFMTLQKNNFQVVVATSHEQPVYVNGKETNKLTFASADFTEVSDLVLWMSYDKAANRRKAVVVKSRASWPYWPEGIERPRIFRVLPAILEPLDGMTYPELIQAYLDEPTTDHLEPNPEDLKPWERPLSEDERLIIQASIEDAKVTQAQLKVTEEMATLVRVGKNKLLAELREQLPTIDGPEIARILSDNGVDYTPDRHQEIYDLVVRTKTAI